MKIIYPGEDFRALHRTEKKLSLLNPHRGGLPWIWCLNRNNETGSNGIQVGENYENLIQGFMLNAWRERRTLSRLADLAAFIISQ